MNVKGMMHIDSIRFDSIHLDVLRGPRTVGQQIKDMNRFESIQFNCFNLPEKVCSLVCVVRRQQKIIAVPERVVGRERLRGKHIQRGTPQPPLGPETVEQRLFSKQFFGISDWSLALGVWGAALIRMP